MSAYTCADLLLRHITSSGGIRADLSPASINCRLNQLQGVAGLNLGGNLSGHSFLVGAALDLLLSVVVDHRKSVMSALSKTLKPVLGR